MTRVPPPCLGVDIGGTSVKLGLVVDGAVRARAKLATQEHADMEALAAAVARAAARLAGPRPVAAGLASPGWVRPADGLILAGAVNVPQIQGQPLRAVFGRHLGLPVTALNDGVAAAWAEARFGAGRGLSRFVLLTLGTGVGGAVVLDGVPVLGRDDAPPELGGIVLDQQSGLPDWAGVPGLTGTLEQYAGLAGFARAYAALGGAAGTIPEALVARAAAGDTRAGQALDAVAGRIAQALGTLVNALHLEACVLGGGVAGAALLDRVRGALPRFTWPPLLAQAGLRLARHGNDAGLLGAAAAALAPPPALPPAPPLEQACGPL